jgi:hypothetical protein
LKLFTSNGIVKDKMLKIAKNIQKAGLVGLGILGILMILPFSNSSIATAAPIHHSSVTLFAADAASCKSDEDSRGDSGKGGAYVCVCSKSSCIYRRYITPAVQLLSAAVGVLAVISFISAGIQYSSAGSDPQKVGAARKRIGNTVFGLIAYIFLLAFLNWVVPGGLV